MRGIILLLSFAATLAHAATNGFVETRDLRLDAEGIGHLEVETGSGDLSVVGSPDLDEVQVNATISVPGRNEDGARQLIEDSLVLTLERRGDSAVLKSYFEETGFGWGDGPGISLEVRVPSRLGLAVDDGSGAMEVRDVLGDVSIDDGSGSITLRHVGGEVRIEDGSGSVSVTGVGGSLSIVDGSGSIEIREVGGSVRIDDGSGGIDVDDVEQDLIVEESGSGSLRVANVRGKVQVDE
ncbi:MAG: hypothetical protein OEW35_05730 [Gammaproteobacteria bacterium]|nr:hypothetical protein [Gammaproteobacteria bacterium]MDH4255265.1 hypothetical protein [Gammaproteobacteria bacterium]MDH5309997.1 hypothetical protein [Gammaproteobacteria bacterium]